MRNIKKFLSIILASLMVLGAASCGRSGKTDPADYKDRVINIGSWWRQYYATGDAKEDLVDYVNAQYEDTDDEVLRAEKEVNQRIAEAKWNKVSEIKEKYKIDFYWQNLTYTGTRESLYTSTLAGTPDCDVYLVDTSIAIPAQNNGLLLDLHTILPEDHDLFTDQTVFSYLDLGDGKACILRVQGGMTNTYPLAFNIQMLEANNLEDPRELYKRGEWTWDKFIEYCRILTQDTDGDGQIDQYGFGGYIGESFRELCFSNGTAAAGGATETLSSAATGEVLKLISDMYNTYNVCYPYDFAFDGGNPSDTMRKCYNNGNVAFFPVSVWIQSESGNYPTVSGKDQPGNLTWDTAYVQWPVGPSGSQESNACVNSSDGNFLVIPANVKEPERVFEFLYDLYNYFDGDTSFRDDPATLDWWYNETSNKPELKEENFEVQKYCMAHPGIELWESLDPNMYDGFERLIAGEMTPAQFQETFSQELQTALDEVFK